MPSKTTVSIEGEGFLINGEPTYRGRSFQGMKIEGLLLNSRMVQATFDDLNPETRERWVYPDTGEWDPERNVTEFLAALPLYRQLGLLAITINVQGGNPRGYSDLQPWHNSGWAEKGELRPEYEDRLRRVISKADELGLVVILGLFYFGQDERLRDEATVKKALDIGVNWVLEHGFTNVLIEVNNECDVPRYEHEILQPHRVHELVELVKQTAPGGRRLLVGTSYGGGSIPGERVVAASDFVLVHGNGVEDPDRIAEIVRETRALPTYRPMPILFNEDDHFDFDRPQNNMLAALLEYASWGYFDPGENDYRDGYQSLPVNWGLNTERKQAFFDLVGRASGATQGGEPPA
jgi:hypothetical protein